MMFKKYRKLVEQLKGEKLKLQRDTFTNLQKLKEFRTKVMDLEEAREVINIAAKETQSKLQYHISDITSMVLEEIFDDPYNISVEFVDRRNKTECDITFERNGHKITPLDAAEGGALDVASFALRIASWAMQNPKTNNIIILDEPFKHLSVEYQDKASNILHQLCEKLNIQIIVVTHKSKLVEYADKIFKVHKINRISKVEEI